MIILDTSGLLSAIDGSQTHHHAAAAALRQAEAPLLLSPFVLAELDYLLATRVSRLAEQALLGQVADGVYRLESFSLTTWRERMRSSIDTPTSTSVWPTRP